VFVRCGGEDGGNAAAAAAAAAAADDDDDDDDDVIDTDELILQSLKSMGPSSIELELSLLSSTPAAAAAAAAAAADNSDADLIINFIDFLIYLFSTKRDVDLATSYLGLLLKVS